MCTTGPRYAASVSRLALTAATLTPLVSTAAAANRTVPNAFAPNHRVSDSASTNWSGYAATGATFTSVSATWTQPVAACGATDTYSSFWVGLDGDTSATVEQTGSEADCSSGAPVYTSWYEMFPRFPVYYADPVRPGDVFEGSVTTDGNGTFTLTLGDTTAGWSHTVSAMLKEARLASAEAVAEAPSSGSTALPLTDFGTVGFSSAMADGRPIGAFGPDRINMAAGGVTKSTTSSLSGGSSFSVAWQNS